MSAQRVALLLVVLLPCTAVCQEIPWQAERVMLRRDGVRAGKPVAGHLVRQGMELSADGVYTVIRADGGLLELGDNLGWVTRADVVRMSEASAFYTARIKEEPTAAKWYGRRAMVAMSRNLNVGLTARGTPQVLVDRPSDAVDDLREAVRLDPTNTNRRECLSMVYMALGEFDQAAEECEAIIRFAPQSASSYVTRGIIRSSRKDTTGALTDMERAAELDSTSVGVLDALAMAYHCAEQQSKADAVLRRVAVMTATSAWEYWRRANARGITGDSVGMLEDLAEVVRLDPANIEARRLRGCLLRERGEYRAALAEFRQTSRLQPGDKAAARMEAFLLATSKDDTLRDGKRAVVLAERAVGLAGTTPESSDLEALAAAYAEVGDFPAAVATQKRAILAIEGKAAYYERISSLRWWREQYDRDQPRRE